MSCQFLFFLDNMSKDEMNITDDAGKSAVLAEHHGKMHTYDSLDRDRIFNDLTYLDEYMPPAEKCVFRLTMTRGLIMKRLFLAIREIVSEARLVLSQDKIEVVHQQDKESGMVVQAILSTQSMKRSSVYTLNQSSLFIPLNVDALNYAMFPIRADDIVGMCVTKSSCEKSLPTIDLYVMKSFEHAHCYINQCEFLIQEYKYFGNAIFKMGNPSWSVELHVHQFKLMLSSWQSQAKDIRLEFGNRAIDFIPQLFISAGRETRLSIPSSWMSNMVVNQAPQVVDTPCFEIKKCLKSTKAAKLSKLVTITYARDYPLLVQYAVEDWGQLTFRIFGCPLAEPHNEGLYSTQSALSKEIPSMGAVHPESVTSSRGGGTKDHPPKRAKHPPEVNVKW